MKTCHQLGIHCGFADFIILWFSLYACHCLILWWAPCMVHYELSFLLPSANLCNRMIKLGKKMKWIISIWNCVYKEENFILHLSCQKPFPAKRSWKMNFRICKQLMKFCAPLTEEVARNIVNRQIKFYIKCKLLQQCLTHCCEVCWIMSMSPSLQYYKHWVRQWNSWGVASS